MMFDSYFHHVRGLASKIVIDGEFLGSVWAYPFLLDSVTSKDVEEIKTQMSDVGAKDEDIRSAVDHLKKVTPRELESLTDLTELVSDEISTFHEEISKREERITDLNHELGDKYRYHNMIGKSKEMKQVYHLLEKISNSESSVFIQGENGTGKELVAKAIHFNSTRKENVFLAVNCSAFNDNLLDSELFGHMKGAFTGAVKDKKGLFESANHGTLFLDEIGDTSLSMQVKLLRVLQEGTYLPVGASTPRKANVRIIAATNRNIKELMDKGEFREDLFYRINVINVHLPPLRKRPEDINLLIDFFLHDRSSKSGHPMKNMAKKCLEKMFDYPWPGNVRELENEIERLLVLSGEDRTIQAELLSQRILNYASGPSEGGGLKGGGGIINTSGTLRNALEEVEMLMIREGLKRCNFNKSKLAKELGMSRAGLIMKVDKYNLDKRKKVVNG